MAFVQSTTHASNPLGVQVIAVTSIFYTLAFVSVVLRVVAKYIRGSRFASHDYLIFGALLGCTGSIAVILEGVVRGKVGLHIAKVTDEEIVITLKALFAGSWTWIVSTVLIKLSILQLYLEIFAPSRAFRMACYILELFTVLFIIGIILTVALICRPIQKNWLPLIPGECGDRLAEEVTAATGVFVLDLALVLLPMPVLWNLKAPLRKRLVISIMFSMGVGVMAINIARIVITVNLDQDDFTYSNAYAFMLAALETFIGIIVACLPTFAPLLKPASYRRGNIQSYNKKPSRGGSEQNRTIGSTPIRRKADDKTDFRSDTFDRLDSVSGHDELLEMEDSASR